MKRGEASAWGDFALAGVSAAALAVVLVMVFADNDVAARAPERLGEPIGELTLRTNEVRRRMDRTLVWNGLVTGTKIYERDAVYVGPDSAATIRLVDGSQIDINETSLVVIALNRPENSKTGVIAVDILRGGVSGRAAKRLELRSAGSATRLKKGTAAAVQVRKDKTTRVAVKEGEASVETAAGKEAVVREGERQTVDSEGESSEVSRPTIELQAPADGARVYVNRNTGALQFGWSALPGRGQYRLQVAGDAGFSDIVVEKRSKRPGASVAPLGAGVYFWRVTRGRDYSEERRLLLIDDWPPVPYRPQPEAVVDLSEQASLSLAWGAVPSVTHYRVELARGRSFKTPLYSLRTDQPSHILRADEVKLEEGGHCFRVRADEPDRESSPWSRVVCFRIVVKPVLRAPEVYDPTREDSGTGEQGSWWRRDAPKADRALALGYRHEAGRERGGHGREE